MAKKTEAAKKPEIAEKEEERKAVKKFSAVPGLAIIGCFLVGLFGILLSFEPSRGIGSALCLLIALLAFAFIAYLVLIRE